jgi:excisionase family DNA binding protein
LLYVHLYKTRPYMLTLGQAAKETGKSKTAIANAIREGRISATRLEGGQYQIDPAELFRVYHPIDRQADSTGVQTVTPLETTGLQREAELLRELVEQIKDERDDLRRRLDDAEAARQKEAEAREQSAVELRRLTLLITHQQEPKPPSPPAPEATTTEPQGKGKLWEKLFGRVK